MTWEGELYLELHNGTYTTMAEHKYYNRFMETLLRDVEILHYMSFLEHPQADVHQAIKQMWYTFLIDQFHDVLPGTCTYLTVDDTRENFKNLKIKCEEIYTEAVRNLLPDHSVVSVNRIRPAYDSLNINSDTEMVVTFNGLTQDRTDVITFKNG